MEIKLNNKYVIGTHVMWFEIEMYKDFVDGLLNLMETVENPENVSIDICFNMTERLETIDREKTSPEDLIHKFNEQNNEKDVFLERNKNHMSAGFKLLKTTSHTNT